jgi:hypothetical protein
MRNHLLAGTIALAVATTLASGAMASNENREEMSRGRVAHAGADMAGPRMHHGAMQRHAGYARRGYLGEDGGVYGAYDAYDAVDAGPGVTIGVGPAPGYGPAYGFGPGGCLPEDYGRYGRCNGIGFVGY